MNRKQSDDPNRKKFGALMNTFPDDSTAYIKDKKQNLEQTYVAIGSKLGKYRIMEEIDRGGMAVVYKARQLDLDRIVALKVLPANITINSHFVERFFSEAQSVAKLNHPSIVSIYEVSTENNIYFIAMDYVSGTNLHTYLSKEKPKLVKVLEIIAQLAEGLHYAHQQKILHRDLKLNNVIMREDGRPVIIDFGLAKTLEDETGDITKTGEIVGSPAYMAPERLVGGTIDGRSDICSLGIMLYEMLTFKNPYLDPRSMVQTTKNVIEANPVSPRKMITWLPVEIEAITLKAMAKDPDNRYSSMKEFAEDIKRYQNGEPVHANPPSLLSNTVRFGRKHWAPITITGIITLFTVIVLTIISIQNRKEKSHWTVDYQETFDTLKTLTEEWGVGPHNSEEKPWGISDQALHYKGEKPSFIKLKSEHTNNLKVSFDLKIKDFNSYNFGVFILGKKPEFGYSFHINRGKEGLAGITTPDSDFLFYDYNPADTSLSSLKEMYSITVQRLNNRIKFFIDNKLMASIDDFFPPLGTDHQNIGFFSSEGEISIDNLTIHTRAVPRLAKPTIVADRFWATGNISSALDEYENLEKDFPKNKIGRKIKLQIIDCLIRLGKYKEAREYIDKFRNNRTASTSEKAQALYLKSKIFYGMKDGDPGISIEDSLKIIRSHLNKYYNEEKSNGAVAMDIITRIADRLSSEDETAGKRLSEYVEKYPEYSKDFGRLQLMLLEDCIKKGENDKARRISENMLVGHIEHPTILARARTLTGRIHLDKRKKYWAMDMLNKAIGTHGTVGSWMGWNAIAQIYYYDGRYSDAYSIYRKVYKEAGSLVMYKWISRLRMGEMCIEGNASDDPQKIFRGVLSEKHFFKLPKLIAEYYTTAMEDRAFFSKYKELSDDPWYHMHSYYKKLMNNNQNEAVLALRNLMDSVPKYSWPYALARKKLQNL